MEIITTDALISINGTFIVQLISFLIFVAVLNRVMIRPLRGASQQRDVYLRQMKKEIVDAREEMEQLSAALEKKKEKIREEAFAFTRTLEEEGGRQAGEIIDATRQQAGEMRNKMEEEMRVRTEMARKSLEREADALTTTIMEKILDRRLVQ